MIAFLGNSHLISILDTVFVAALSIGGRWSCKMDSHVRVYIKSFVLYDETYISCWELVGL